MNSLQLQSLVFHPSKLLLVEVCLTAKPGLSQIQCWRWNPEEPFAHLDKHSISLSPAHVPTDSPTAPAPSISSSVSHQPRELWSPWFFLRTDQETERGYLQYSMIKGKSGFSNRTSVTLQDEPHAQE